MCDLQTPPTEIEVAELVHALQGFGPLGGVVRRLAYQRDKSEAEVEGLQAALETDACPKCHVDGYWYRACKLKETEIDRLRTALERSPYDISPCGECGNPVVCLPEGLALCEHCADAADEVQESEESDGVTYPCAGAERNHCLARVRERGVFCEPCSFDLA